jgi:hypothetical protein
MKFYKKWRSEIGVPIEVEATKTGVKSKRFRWDEDIYVGIQYTDGTSYWWKRQKAYQEDNFRSDPINIEDLTANFHTDSIEAYEFGKYTVDDEARELERSERRKKFIKKMDFLKSCNVVGAKYLYGFYRSIPATANKNLSPSQRPMVWWNKWNAWKKENPEQYHLLITKLKQYVQV